MGAIDTIRRDGRAASLDRVNRGRRMVSMALLAAVEWLERAAERRRSRRLLLEMTEEQLKDIGVSPARAYREAMRPFWD